LKSVEGNKLDIYDEMKGHASRQVYRMLTLMVMISVITTTSLSLAILPPLQLLLSLVHLRGMHHDSHDYENDHGGLGQIPRFQSIGCHDSSENSKGRATGDKSNRVV
jgi:hypothetical protein